MSKHKVFVAAVISLIAFSALCTHANTYGEEEEDDEDIIKHFEQLLKGKANPPSPVAPQPSPVAPQPPPPSDQDNFDKSEEGPSQEAELVQEEGQEDFKEENIKNPEVPSSPSGQSACVCKKYYECNVGGKEDADNPDIGDEDPSNSDLMEVDVRFGPENGPCSHYLEICCDSVRDNTTEIRNPQYQHTLCGKRNLKGVGFSVKGAVNEESQFGEFPWMAAIIAPERQEGKSPINVFVCGGSLIHPSVVMTAAHCVYKKKAEELRVRLGEWDTQTSDELYPHKDHFVKRMVVHEDFYPGALYNDVALLFLNEETKIAPHIDTVCLPPPNLNFDGKRCYASGWGRDSFGKEGKYQVILKKLDLPVVPRGNCEYALRRTRLGRRFKLHESFVCAGGEPGKDTCRGDGGSPLVCLVEGSDFYVQYGIVAWGIGCGEEGLPGVYVNVPRFVPWISKRMSEARLNTDYYKLGRQLF